MFFAKNAPGNEIKFAPVAPVEQYQLFSLTFKKIKFAPVAPVEQSKTFFFTSCKTGNFYKNAPVTPPLHQWGGWCNFFNIFERKISLYTLLLQLLHTNIMRYIYIIYYHAYIKTIYIENAWSPWSNWCNAGKGGLKHA